MNIAIIVSGNRYVRKLLVNDDEWLQPSPELQAQNSTMTENVPVRRKHCSSPRSAPGGIVSKVSLIYPHPRMIRKPSFTVVK